MNNNILENKNRQYKPHFMLLPSLSCPAACSYCFGPNIGPAMNMEMVDRVIDYIDAIIRETSQEKAKVTLHGGEPLAAGYETIEYLVTSLSRHFVDISIGMQSNLWLLDDKFCALFAEHNVDIGTSLDGPKELNDAQRGEGYFEKTINGIELAASHGISASCIVTFTSQNLPHWREVFDFFIQNSLHFSIHPAVPSIERSTGLEISAEEYKTLFEEMFGYYLKNCRNVRVSTFDQICQSVATGQGGVCTLRDCLGMFLAIDSYGDIYTCQRFAGKKEYALGNVVDKPSMQMLVDKPSAKFFLNRESEMSYLCKECDHYNYCKGGCAYNAFSSTKEKNVVDPYCDAYKDIFLSIKKRLHEEMISKDNFDAIVEYGPTEKGNPLLRKGEVIALTKEETHPYFVSRTAKRIIAAYELAKGSDLESVAQRLVDMDISRSKETAKRSITAMKNRMQPHGQLNKLYLHVTWNCQLKCTHCYAANNTNSEEMTIDDIERIIRDSTRCGFKEVVITGGEPLMHKDRDNLLKRFAQIKHEMKPVNIILRTNFTMKLTVHDFIDIFRAFDEIVVSVDGGKNEHDLRRGEGSYEKLVENLELFAKSKEAILTGLCGERPARLAFSASLKAKDVNNAAGIEVKALAERFNVAKVKFRPLLPLGRAQDFDEPLVSEALRMHMSAMDLIEEGFHPVMTCGIGQNLYVEPSGESFPCYAYHKPHSFLGNVLNYSVESITKSEKFSKLQSHTVETNVECKKCNYRYLCGGPCRAWSKGEAQYNLDAPPDECVGLKKRAERLYKAALGYLELDV